MTFAETTLAKAVPARMKSGIPVYLPRSAVVMSGVVVKYEIWGRKQIGKGKRRRLAFGFSNEGDAQAAKTDCVAKGWLDCILAQRPPRNG